MIQLIRSLLVTLLVTGCSSISTNFDYDTEADFSSLESYSWIEGGQGRTLSDLDSRRVEEAVNRALEAAGYVPRESGADFQVAFHFASVDRVRVTDRGTSYHHRYSGFGMRSVDVYEYEEGTLIIDIVDPDTNQLLWRGSATGTVHQDRTPKEREERVREAVQALLDEFPPQD